MSEDVVRKRPRPAAIARTTSRRDMSCDILSEIIDENCMLEVVEETSSIAQKNRFVNDRISYWKEEEINKPLDFLHYCGVCRRSLGSERDIYIYRGESAFCSNECREKQIRFDTKKCKTSCHDRIKQ